MDLVRYRAAATLIPQCRSRFTAAIRDWAVDARNSPQDIWVARQPDPKALSHTTPVVVAVWDGGYDPALFPGQLATDQSEPLDGRDNDGNGVVDD